MYTIKCYEALQLVRWKASNNSLLFIGEVITCILHELLQSIFLNFAVIYIINIIQGTQITSYELWLYGNNILNILILSIANECIAFLNNYPELMGDNITLFFFSIS